MYIDRSIDRYTSMNTVARCARPATRAGRPAGRVVGGGGVVAKASPSRSVTHLVATLVVLASSPQYASAVEPIRIERDLDQKEMYFKTINTLFKSSQETLFLLLDYFLDKIFLRL